MSSREHLSLMADYNAWMNGRIYDATSKLAPEEIARDRGAFFGSILGTLNHLVVADRTWMGRFAGLAAAHPALDPVLTIAAPTALDQILFADFAALRAVRGRFDEAIRAFVSALDAETLATPLAYRNMAGTVARRQALWQILTHVFNHQTHHRGQVTTLLTQAGIDVGATDLIGLVPNID